MSTTFELGPCLHISRSFWFRPLLSIRLGFKRCLLLLNLRMLLDLFKSCLNSGIRSFKSRPCSCHSVFLSLVVVCCRLFTFPFLPICTLVCCCPTLRERKIESIPLLFSFFYQSYYQFCVMGRYKTDNVGMVLLSNSV